MFDGGHTQIPLDYELDWETQITHFIGKISVTVILRLVVRIYLTSNPNGGKV